MKCNVCSHDILGEFEECPCCGACPIAQTGTDSAGDYWIHPITKEKYYV